MAASLRQSIERFSDPCSLDASVEEVFGTVLGWDCQLDPEPNLREEEAVTAVVGLGGVLSGACILRAGGGAARMMVARMTGMEFTEIDETVQDGMGELCNMVAGTWKSRQPELAAGCGLSVPAVITGRAYNLHVHAPEFELRHAYCAEGVSFAVTIVCDGLR